MSERYLIQQKFYYGIGKSGHLADGILILPDDTKIAIEVELSMKSRRRLEKIINAFAAQLKISEAWYFCADNIIPAVNAIVRKRSFIKVHSLNEYLDGQPFASRFI